CTKPEAVTLGSRQLLEAYRVTVILAAAGLTLERPAGAATGPVDPVIVATLLLAVMLAIQYPLTIAANHKLTMDTAALFATAILRPTPAAMLAVAGATTAGWSLSALRKLTTSPVRPRLRLVLPGVL